MSAQKKLQPLSKISATHPPSEPPAQIIENLTALKSNGLSYGIFYFPEAASDRSGIELFEREVIPALA
ncbi:MULTISPECIES: hypothetical protein [unclassified Rhodococcus (in: high G+C Gram-positive bacteria)]|uniref:hypothetical protein n=1 Tax=unclassified Rhodococcus (in: high G+C Gram-positive bacteria) TaxID=192944 RepID=UPI001FF9BDCF|nr:MULTISPECIES: hypothetical protein [unclassified Rhodococcus (in: high G+C Gram-positive bacteria)]